MLLLHPIIANPYSNDCFYPLHHLFSLPQVREAYCHMKAHGLKRQFILSEITLIQKMQLLGVSYLNLDVHLRF